jgi:hypothetical protein
MSLLNSILNSSSVLSGSTSVDCMAIILFYLYGIKRLS